MRELLVFTRHPRNGQYDFCAALFVQGCGDQIISFWRGKTDSGILSILSRLVRSVSRRTGIVPFHE